MRPWTSEEVEDLKKLYASGYIGMEAAHELGRSVDSVIKKAGRLGLTCSPDPSPPPESEERDEAVAKLQAMIQSHNVPVVEYFGPSALFGVISDTHYGSIYERPDLVQKAYEIMHKEGITDVYHAGDFLEGSGMRKGHEYELAVVGADKQIAHALEVHPKVKGMTTRFILGSHDLSFFKGSGSDVGARIAERDDLVYLGTRTSATIPLKVNGTTLSMRLEHPAKGSSYALSYQVQKYIDALPGGRKPHIVIIGHYHKADFLPAYRNIAAVQAGCFQSQTEWMRERGLAAHLGFWMLEVHANKAGIARVKAEFVPFYEV